MAFAYGTLQPFLKVSAEVVTLEEIYPAIHEAVCGADRCITAEVEDRILMD